MSTFSKTNFKTLNYNSFRPHYPPSFYKILSNYVIKNNGKLPIDQAVDLGCGTGVATYPLLNFVEKVIGLDLSASMIDTANSIKLERLKVLDISDSSRISFKAGSVEDFINSQDNDIQESSVNLIIAAQCIHWFQNYDLFFKNSAKLLKQGGTLAYFYYIDPRIVNFSGPGKDNRAEVLEKAYAVYDKYVYGDDYIGPYWEQPGRSILKDFCVETNKHIPRDLYEDVTIETFKASEDTYPNEDKDLDLKKTSLDIKGYLDYVGTYSGYHNYKETTGKTDLLENEFLNELLEVTGWDLEKTKIDLVWNTGYTFVRKK
ncbi:unnamed protein product [Candida verbasci]|uniref:Methyltransferase type 11 domain-containing protein n=1 Tax=Candida verbasci TaxID=1227364 RepID=A0A9W4X9C9_9ASCO|nr:unnamed protein product [Candida verbasci]